MSLGSRKLRPSRIANDGFKANVPGLGIFFCYRDKEPALHCSFLDLDAAVRQILTIRMTQMAESTSSFLSDQRPCHTHARLTVSLQKKPMARCLSYLSTMHEPWTFAAQAGRSSLLLTLSASSVPQSLWGLDPPRNSDKAFETQLNLGYNKWSAFHSMKLSFIRFCRSIA